VVSLVPDDRSLANVLRRRQQVGLSWSELQYRPIPHGLVLGPVEFVAYTKHVADLFHQHEVNHHLYAEDQQIYLHAEPGLAFTRLTSLATCFSDLSDWCASLRLQLNAAKTELIWLGSRSILRRLTSDNHSLSIGSVVVHSLSDP